MQEHRTEHRSCTWLTANHLLANVIFLAIPQRHADIGSTVLGTTISVTTTVIATARNSCRETTSSDSARHGGGKITITPPVTRFNTSKQTFLPEEPPTLVSPRSILANQLRTFTYPKINQF